jgi:hypothetical protein
MDTLDEARRPRSFRDLDPESRMRELASLQLELRKPDPITPARLKDWVSVSADRSALLRGGVWGGIHWPKAFGRPLTPSITDGFIITHEFWGKELADAGGDQYPDLSKYKVQDPPSVWDATKTPDQYRVGFFFFAGLGGIFPNKLTVRLAPVPWEKVHVRSGMRRLDPMDYSPFGSLGAPMVIPDFEVQHIPYRHGRYIEPLRPSLDLP